MSTINSTPTIFLTYPQASHPAKPDTPTPTPLAKHDTPRTRYTSTSGTGDATRQNKFDTHQHTTMGPTTQHSLNDLCDKLSKDHLTEMMRNADSVNTPKYLSQMRAMLSEDRLKPLLSGKDAAVNAQLLDKIRKLLNGSVVGSCMRTSEEEKLKAYTEDRETKKNDMIFELLKHGYDESHVNFDNLDHYGSSALEYILKMERNSADMESLAQVLNEFREQLNPEKINAMRRVNSSPTA